MSEPLPGLDVSHFQASVDWTRVAAAGTAFAFIKATEGVQTSDAFFEMNRRAAALHYIPAGAYHFFHPARPIGDQVRLFLQKVGALVPGELPPVLDLEAPDEWTPIAPADRVSRALAWLEQVEQALGVRPIIYAGPGFVRTTLGSDARLARYRLWLADFASAPEVPSPWAGWTFWQFTEHGAADGIAGPVDLDRFNGTLGDLKRLQVQPSPAIVVTPAMVAEAVVTTTIHMRGAVMAGMSDAQAQDLLRLDENRLLEQLGARSVAAASAPAMGIPMTPPSGPSADMLGVKDDMKELGSRILRRWNRVAYELACGSDPDDATTRQELENALKIGDAAAIGVLSTALIGIGLSALVAPVLAALIVKKFFKPAYGEFCDFWKGKLPQP